MISYCGESHVLVAFDFVSDSTAMSSVFGRTRTFLALDAVINNTVINHFFSRKKKLVIKKKLKYRFFPPEIIIRFDGNLLYVN